eukprot:78670-Pleurochrysis_carterae.AAC.1
MARGVRTFDRSIAFAGHRVAWACVKDDTGVFALPCDNENDDGDGGEDSDANADGTCGGGICGGDGDDAATAGVCDGGGDGIGVCVVSDDDDDDVTARDASPLSAACSRTDRTSCAASPTKLPCAPMQRGDMGISVRPRRIHSSTGRSQARAGLAQATTLSTNGALLRAG